MKVKELVYLREKPNRNGGSALFLDYYINGVRYKEYLKMYIVPERTKMDKYLNAETRKTALAIKAKRVLEIQNSQGGFRKPIKMKDMLVSDFLVEQSKRYIDWGKEEYAKTLIKIAKWIGKYKRDNLRNVDAGYLEGLFIFLKKHGRSDNTIYLYYSTLRTQFNNAYKLGLIADNPFNKMEANQKPKKPENHREYLTLEELRKLMATPCKDPLVAKAFLFSCFTGLRISDIEALTWDKILKTDSGYQIEATQKKTKKIVVVPLSENAINQLPPMPKKGGKVWNLVSRSEINRRVQQWVKAAGIDKHISFHCSRHTCATTMLTCGVDIYTVSSILGHTNIETTQIYAKIVDAKKVAAVNLVPTL